MIMHTPTPPPTVFCQDSTGAGALNRRAAVRRSSRVYNCFGLDTVWYGKQTRTLSRRREGEREMEGGKEGGREEVQ